MQASASNTPNLLLSRRRRWASLAVLTMSLLVVAMDTTILNVALPSMSLVLLPTSEQMLWMVDAYSLTLAGLLVTMSALADRLGRKRMLCAGYVLFGIGSAAVLFAQSADFVIFLRLVLGLAGAMVMPATLSMLRSIFPDPKERASALAVWAAAATLGTAIGPVVGGFLLEHFTWHAAFLVNLPLMLCAVLAAGAVLPEVRLEKRGPWDFLGMIMSIAGMSLLPWAVKRFAQQTTLADPAALAGLAAALVLLGLFARRCLRVSNPVLDLGLFKRRALSGAVLAAFGCMFALAAMMLLLAQWMQLVQGYTPLETGVRMLPFVFAGLASALVAPFASRRFGARATMAVGLGLSALGILFVWAGGERLGYGEVFVAMLCIGAGEGPLSVGSAVIMSVTPLDKAGKAAALEETSYDLGSVFGVSIVGSIAALAYKAGFDAASMAGLDASLAASARESLGGALEAAREADLPHLAKQAVAAFSHSLSEAALAAGLILLVFAAATFFMVPKGTDIDAQEA